jgi:hypothetical protein
MTAAPARSLTALAACVTALFALFAASATGAAAATIGTCPGTATTPFAPWGDTNPYTLVPYGDFEAANFATASGWKLTGGATTVSGNEPFYVHAKTDTKSLSLPAGATATTPPVCVNVYSPTIRFFTTGGNSTTTLKVEVLYTLAGGTTGSLTVAQLPGSTTWAPTPSIYFYANLLSLLSTNGTTNVRFRFTAVGTTAFKIDDLYVDPRKGV